MKKLLVLLVLAGIYFTPLYAQDITFGAKAGVSFATLQPDLPDPATRTTFHLGGVAEIAVTDMFSVQPELLYFSTGVKDESDDDETVRLSYIALPIMAKYYIVDALSVECGPQLGFLLSAEVEDDGETIDLKENTKSVDLGLAIGLGYKLEQGVNVAVRYFLGSDINDIGEDPEQFKNRVFQISVGYFFK